MGLWQRYNYDICLFDRTNSKYYVHNFVIPMRISLPSQLNFEVEANLNKIDNPDETAGIFKRY